VARCLRRPFFIGLLDFDRMHRHRALVLIGALLATGAHAQTGSVNEIWKCRGADGRWTYTNDRREAEQKKCQVVTRQINVAPSPAPRAAPAAPAARPEGFPRESASERASRTASSRDILEKELATEETALAKARQDLAAQEEVRYGNERNYERVLERLQPYKDSVETHEKNVEALKRELNNLR
jgi:hypothetical protein